MKLCSNNKKLKTSKENIFNILIFFTFNILQINKLSNIFFRKKKMKKMKSFMERIGKKFVIKGFYRNFLTLKGKFHHQFQIASKFGQCI